MLQIHSNHLPCMTSSTCPSITALSRDSTTKPRWSVTRPTDFEQLTTLSVTSTTAWPTYRQYRSCTDLCEEPFFVLRSPSGLRTRFLFRIGFFLNNFCSPFSAYIPRLAFHMNAVFHCVLSIGGGRMVCTVNPNSHSMGRSLDFNRERVRAVPEPRSRRYLDLGNA